MEEAVVGAVVGASIQVLLQSLIFKSMEQINLIWDFKEDLGILKDSLRMTKAYLSNAEVRRLDNEPVEVWLQQLESVAFKADAVLDEINYQLIRKKVENKRNETVSSFFLRIEMDRRMANKIKDINKELEIINKNALSYGLHMSIMAAHHSLSDRETDSFCVDPIVVGREKDLSKIVEMLVTNPTEDVFSIIPIVGMGGLGKTTLAREVFNDEKITNHFDKKIWVCVPENYDAKTLFKMILETGENFVSREVFLKKIHHHVGSKRYLLVLDDVWSDDPWDDFISSLLGVSSAKGNGIIVTTRKEKVAERVQTLPFYRLSTLSDDDCWSIIKVKAFKGLDVSLEFEEIGKSIAQRCKGLPLAAKVVGGSLKGNTREEWLSFLESEPSYSSQYEKYILKVLKLSFDRLPSSSLKKCFAYCSIFPQDYWIRRDQLIELWMAEGFLQSNQKNDMETEGNKFFNHLLQNSLFKDAMRDEHGHITHCKMHSLVHELACSVSGIKDSGSNDMHRVRYHHLNLGKDEPFPLSQEQSVYLRTLFLEGTFIENLLSNFKCLHVLKIIGCDLEELPIQIQNLIHLRYLEISCIMVTSLPDSIGKLYNLQTLRTGCMTKLPNTLINLICLRHLHIYSSRLPPGIGKLTCLQTLPYYKVSHEKGCGIGELGSLKNLRGRLEIQNLEMVSDIEEATHADLYGKANITHLVFAWSYDPRRGEINDESVLEGLQPPQNLKSLEIKGYKGINFPLWTMEMTLNNLVDMTLSGCDNCEEIPMLGHLPHLKSLSLIGLPSVKSITLRFYGIESCSNTYKNIFPALEKLELFRMPSLTEWVDAQVSTTIFPRLEYLRIWNCPNLKSAPNHFACLRKLFIEIVDGWLPLANICDGGLSSLEILFVGYMSGLVYLPDRVVANNPNLTSLTIWHCHNLTHLVSSSLGSSLEYLKISSCESLRELPNELHRLQSLKTLIIDHCSKLKSIPHQSGGLISLEILEIKYCQELTTLPIDLLEPCATKITSFTLRSLPSLMNLSEVIACLPRMTRLCDLTILDVPKLMTFPKEFSSVISSLQSLRIGQFSDSLDLVSFNDIFQVLQSLRCLILYGHECWEFLPDNLQYLTTLEELRLYDFGLTEALPDWLGNFSSLQVLHVEKCKKLMHLPSKEAMQRLTKLQHLEISDCPLLQERCNHQQSSGSDNSEWSKISHIPRVYTK